MTLLDKARAEIDAVDREMAALFERRMQAVESVIAYKLEQDMPIFDSGREQEVIDRNCQLLEREELAPYFAQLLQAHMDVSKAYQQSILDRAEKAD